MIVVDKQTLQGIAGRVRAGVDQSAPLGEI